MEYFPLGALEAHLGSPLPEAHAQRIVGQILQGLAFMHENQYAHRDIKPSVGVCYSVHTSYVFIAELM